jgi:hypothetical protein
MSSVGHTAESQPYPRISLFLWAFVIVVAIALSAILADRGSHDADLAEAMSARDLPAYHVIQRGDLEKAPAAREEELLGRITLRGFPTGTSIPVDATMPIPAASRSGVAIELRADDASAFEFHSGDLARLRLTPLVRGVAPISMPALVLGVPEGDEEEGGEPYVVLVGRRNVDALFAALGRSRVLISPASRDMP